MKQILLLACVLVLSPITSAQNFEKIYVSNNFDSPRNSKTIDLDKNSYDDIVVCGPMGIGWFKNDGAGNLEKTYIYKDAYVMDFDVVDYDNDTDWDIVGYNTADDELFWLENDGEENFTYNAISATLQGDAINILAVDSDNDDDIDIFYSIDNGTDDKLYLLVNNAGVYAEQYINTAYYYFDIFGIDYADNGYIDIVTWSYTSGGQGVVLLSNDGNNNFTQSTLHEQTDIDLADVIYTDLDNNGTKDLIISDYRQQELYWLENSTGAKHSIATGVDYRELAVVDFNNDNVKDIIYNTQNSGEKITLLQGANPGSSMTFSTIYSHTFDDFDYAYDIELLDINNDDLIDFSYVISGDDEVIYHQNNGNFSFTENILTYKTNNPEYITRVDLDQDGDEDILCVEGDTDIEYFENMGDGSYNQRNIYRYMDSPRYIDVADMDNDGELDIIAASIGDDDLVFLKNDGEENFTQNFITTSSAELSNPARFTLKDYDGDNLIDIAINASTFFGDVVGVYWIKNMGGGSFSEPIEIQEGDDTMQYIISGDFDKDGDQDLITSRNSYDKVGGLYKAVNNGSGNFNYSAIDVSFNCDYLKAVDMDGDEDLDFLLRRIDNTLYWYENDGSFGFTAHQITHSETDLVCVDPINIGGDDDMDLFFYTTISGGTNDERFKVGYFENNGSMNFTQTTLLTGQPQIESAVAVDWDNDTDLDFYIGSYLKDELVLYRNLAINKSAQSITWNQDLTDMTIGETRDLTASASSGLTVTYISSDTDVATISGGDLTVHKAGTFTVTASQTGDATYNAAADVVKELNVVPTSIDKAYSAGIKLYPNPADEQATITSDDQILYIELYNMAGRLVQQKSVGSTTVSVPLENLQSGIYHLRIKTDKDIALKKLIKK